MPNFGIWEWLVILVIVLVIFGASRLRDIGSGLGGAINAFRNEVKEGREQREGEEADTAQEKDSEA
jgi:sec-independent protein translocase protein TatA